MAHCHRFFSISTKSMLRHKIVMQERDVPRHNLRLPEELKRKLGHARIDSGRSMNAEIIARLEESFEPDPASRLMEAMLPIADLDDEDRREMGVLLAGIGAIFSRNR